jgi:pectate lyase
MAQYSITKDASGVTTITASGNTGEPLTLKINIKQVTASGDSLILTTDYFPIIIKPAENSISYGTTTIAQNTKTPQEVAGFLNSYLFPQPAPVETAKVNGFASLGTKTTGGEGGRIVTVTTLSDLKAAASSTEPLIIKVAANITGTGNVPLKSNKTILGINGATLTGVGLRVYGGSETAYIRNIIIQNLKIKNVQATDPKTGGGDNDCIGLKWADHVFIDHCELSADLLHPDNWEFYDGLIDISKASDYVTVSWCRLMNSFKGSGVGGSSDSGKDKLHVSYHHNLFQNIGERSPSLGYAKAHIYNNYFLTSAYASGYAVGVRFGSIAAVEGNYFEGITNPIKLDIDSGSPGYLSSNKENIFVNSGSNRGGSPTKTLLLPYSYTLDNAADIPNLVKLKAGATL